MNVHNARNLDFVSRRLLSNGIGHGPVALMYHSIVEGEKPRSLWEVTLDQFCAQLDFLLESGFIPVGVRELGSSKQQARAVAITFDDGYDDNYAAFSALQSRNIKATWFVVTDYFGRKAGWAAHHREKRQMLSIESIRDMAVAGMYIGSHSCTHPKLTELNHSSARREINDSKAKLENILGQDVVEFAYPYGEHNQDVVDLVRDAGYRFACTSRTGWALLDNDRLRIRRIGVFSNDSVSTLARKLVFADTDVGWSRMVRYGIRRLRDRVGYRV